MNRDPLGYLALGALTTAVFATAAFGGTATECYEEERDYGPVLICSEVAYETGVPETQHGVVLLLVADEGEYPSWSYALTGGARSDEKLKIGNRLVSPSYPVWWVESATDGVVAWGENVGDSINQPSVYPSDGMNLPEGFGGKLFSGTAGDVAARLVKIGGKIMAFSAPFFAFPDAAEANEGSEIYGDDDYLRDLLDRRIGRMNQVLADNPVIAAQKAQDAIDIALKSIEYTDLYVWDELSGEWRSDWARIRDKGEWKAVHFTNDDQKRAVAQRVHERYGGGVNHWLAYGTADGDIIPLDAIQAYQSSRRPADLFAHHRYSPHIDGIVQDQLTRLVGLTNAAYDDFWLVPFGLTSRVILDAMQVESYLDDGIWEDW